MGSIDRNQIKRIYAMGHKLGIVEKNDKEDELHALIWSLTGKRHIKELTSKEAWSVIDRLSQIVPEDPKKPGRSTKSRPERKERAAGALSAAQERKIWKLMFELKKLDKEDGGANVGKRLCGILKKDFGIDATPQDPFRWVDWHTANNLIEALKRYIWNEKRKKGKVV